MNLDRLLEHTTLVRPAPGDLVVVTFPYRISEMQREAVRGVLDKLTGRIGCRALVLEDGMTLQHLPAAELARMLSAEEERQKQGEGNADQPLPLAGDKATDGAKDEG